MQGSTPQKADLSKLTFDQIIKQIRVMHLAMLAGGTINVFLLAYVMGLDKLNFEISDPMILSIAAVAVISLCYIGSMLFKKTLSDVKSSASLNDKLMAYQKAKILNFALVEGPLLMCAITGFIKIDFTLLLLALLTCIYFYFLKPSKEEMLSKLPLSGNDKIFFGGGMALREHEEKFQ